MREADYYTPPQAARILGLSRRRVTQMLNDGGLEGEKLDNGRWRISAVAVAKLLQERSQAPLPPPRRAPEGKAIEEIKERAAISEHRLERLTDSLSRLFTRLERLEDRLDGLEQSLNNRS
jgi:excisionase family DNA binding protein